MPASMFRLTGLSLQATPALLLRKSCVMKRVATPAAVIDADAGFTLVLPSPSYDQLPSGIWCDRQVSSTNCQVFSSGPDPTCAHAQNPSTPYWDKLWSMRAPLFVKSS